MGSLQSTQYSDHLGFVYVRRQDPVEWGQGLRSYDVKWVVAARVNVYFGSSGCAVVTLCADRVPRSVPTVYRPCTDRVPTVYRPCTDRVPTVYRPCTDCVPIDCVPLVLD